MSIHVVTFEHPETPKSFNETSNAHWRVVQRNKKKWQGIFEALLMEQAVPRGFDSCVALAGFRFPVSRRRDAGNFQTPIEKALGDALTAGGWLIDDTHDRFRMATPMFLDKGPALTKVTLWLSPSVSMETAA